MLCYAVMCCVQVLGHDWVTDCGRLPAVQPFMGTCSQPGEMDARATEQQQVLTVLKKQVRVVVVSAGHREQLVRQRLT